MPFAREKTNFPQERVTRRDAARRQLSTAITLVLSNGDAVSSNVLAWSATGVLRGVAENKGLGTFLIEVQDRIRPEYRKQWHSLLREHYNYFKHSDRDPDGVIDDFTPEATTWTLFGACHDYHMVYQQRTWSMLVYHMWFLCRHPEIAPDEGRELVATLMPGLGNPAGKPLKLSVGLAYEMLENGRRSPNLIEGLGPAWLSGLESE